MSQLNETQTFTASVKIIRHGKRLQQKTYNSTTESTTPYEDNLLTVSFDAESRDELVRQLMHILNLFKAGN